MMWILLLLLLHSYLFVSQNVLLQRIQIFKVHNAYQLLLLIIFLLMNCTYLPICTTALLIILIDF
jgi:hypothetical protein